MYSNDQIMEELSEMYDNVLPQELKDRFNVFVKKTETAYWDGKPSILLSLTNAWSEDILREIVGTVNKELNERNLIAFSIGTMTTRVRMLLKVDAKMASRELSKEDLDNRRRAPSIPKTKWRAIDEDYSNMDNPSKTNKVGGRIQQVNRIDSANRDRRSGQLIQQKRTIR